MKTGTTTHYTLCRFKSRPDAACRKLARCRECGRVQYFVWGPLCPDCARGKAKAAVNRPESAGQGRRASPGGR